MEIKNILIDLGGVLYEIDIETTINRYNQMRKPGAEPVNFNKQGQHKWFTLLDNGDADIDVFASGLKETFQLTGDLEEIKQIWRELLIGVLPGRIEAIEKLADHYNLALLSNTNKYHYDVYYPECKPMFDRMDRVFVSFEMGVRKPDPKIFHMALEEMNWEPGETLFLDDSKVNIEAAEKIGIKTYWIETHDDFDRMLEIYAR